MKALLLIAAVFVAFPANAMTLECYDYGRTSRYTFDGGDTMFLKDRRDDETWPATKFVVHIFDDIELILVAAAFDPAYDRAVNGFTVLKVDFGRNRVREWRFIAQREENPVLEYTNCRRLD